MYRYPSKSFHGYVCFKKGMCVFDISLIQVLHCCYSFSRNWKIKKSCWARFSNYLKYYNQGPSILTVLSASCTSNTKVIRELALSVSLTPYDWDQNFTRRELQYFEVIFTDFLTIIFFFPFFNLLFFCAIKITFLPLERFFLSHALSTLSFPDPLFTFLFTRYTIWVVFKQIWTFTLFWFYLWPEKQSALTWNRHWAAYGGNL